MTILAIQEASFLWVQKTSTQHACAVIDTTLEAMCQRRCFNTHAAKCSNVAKCLETIQDQKKRKNAGLSETAPVAAIKTRKKDAF